MQVSKVRAKVSCGDNFHILSLSITLCCLPSKEKIFHLPSQFLSSLLLSSSSLEYLVCNINNSEMQLSISYFRPWQWHDDITAVSKTLHQLFSIHPFKFSHLFLSVNILHNSLPQLSYLFLPHPPALTITQQHSFHTLFILPPFSFLMLYRTYGISLPECATNFSSNYSLKIHSTHLRIKDIYLALFILELYNFIPLCFSLISEWPCYFTAVISSFLSQHLPAASFSLFTL